MDVEGMKSLSVFRGRHYHNIDEKGRIIFPAKLYDVFAEHYDNRLVITSWDGYLLVFPYPEWAAIEEKMFRQSLIRKEVREFQRLFMSGAVDCTFDSQRRILIPPSLRRDAGLDKEIVTAGMGRSIEIWDKGRFEAALDKTSRNVEVYSEYIADLGI
ncbi:MAG: division/cell wall cluster transcriptional repressor MraZ [Syntrophales bacterium]|nr:division/cell wall cluster transcriptional repressor MraZ [Syntrophales bacterium]MCK9528609.1 division/cell wall cluster transcriptional repressor MraZ [Syntrophales bacterium]MDX9923050.1 division/cell wall cluster transcriptional repressor MraZ [Syntrophales bacterium]